MICKMKGIFEIAVIFMLCFAGIAANAEEKLRILTWEGYVQPEDVDAVNVLLKNTGYPYVVEVISPYAEGAEQMFTLIRNEKCDISFLTLFFIKMQGERTSKLLQPININSPRLTNYQHLLPSLITIPIGLDQDRKPLYIPYGGGTYGFYVDLQRVSAADIPTSVKDLWKPAWQGKLSLNISQPWYNIGLTLMSMGKSPFYINDLIVAGKRDEAMALTSPESELQQKTNALYRQASHFWSIAPEFKPELLIVSSWGPEITGANAKGGNWKFINFQEGNMIWLDTINFVKGLTGKKLEAAEIAANYFIGEQVQTRVAQGLSMVAASTLAASNPLIQENPNFFLPEMFVPPYDRVADNLMKDVSDRALQAAGVK